MKKALALLLPTLILGTATIAAAGDEKKKKKKCTAEATVCIREMADSLKQRGWIGIEWDSETKPPAIKHVVQGSPAESGGVQVGDVVKAFAGVSTTVDDEKMWKAMKEALLPGKTITLDIVRDGKEMALDVELIAVPDHIIAQWVGMHVLQNHKAAPEDQVAAKP